MRVTTNLLITTACALAAAGSAAAQEAQRWLSQINLSTARQQAAGDGRGTVIAVLDTGVDIDHPEFRGRITSQATCFGTACAPGATGVRRGDDGQYHGTHVAGIAAAARDGRGVVGAAPAATILPVRVLGPNGSGRMTDVWAGIDYARTRANVLNLSLGPLSSATDMYYLNAAAQTAFVAAAAGNDGRDLASIRTGATYGNLGTGAFLFVGALDTSNTRLASFSNRPSTACLVNSAGACYVRLQDIFITAPGSSIASTVPREVVGSGYGTLSGTSMATPVVAGTAALIMSQWPHLKAKPADVGQILLRTADDLGAPGVDPVFGAGRLNAGRALTTPVGSTRVPTGRTVAGSSETGGFVFGSGAFGRIGGLSLDTILLDEFDRDFGIDLAQNFVSTRRSALNALANPVTGGAARIAIDRSFSATVYATQADLGTGYTNFAADRADSPWVARPQMAFAAEARVSPDVTLGFASGLGVAETFGRRELGASLATQGQTTRVAYDHLALTDGGQVATLGLELGQDGRVTFGLARTQDSDASGFSGPQLATQASFVGYQMAFDAATTVEIVGSHVIEQNGVLGARSGGALALGETAGTTALGLTLDHDAGDGWTLRAGATVGVTEVSSADGLFRDVAPLTSRALALAAERQGVWRHDDAVTFALSKPMRIVDGSARFVAATGRTEDGTLLLAGRDVALSPEGDETRVDMSYRTPVGERWGEIEAVATFRDEPDHVAGEREGALLARYRVAF